MGNQTERGASKVNFETQRSGFKPERNALRQSLPKLLCFRKHDVHPGRAPRAELKSLNVKYLRADHVEAREVAPLRGADVNGTDSSGGCQKRKSFHQDVEEALKSLLWQPYEYQNAAAGRALSPSDDDLEQPSDHDAASTQYSLTDPHLPTPPSPMVINPRAPFHQSTARSPSRDSPAATPSTDPLSRVFSTREASGGCASCGDANAGATMPVSAGGSLSSANVVGLPHHARYPSAPVGWAGSYPRRVSAPSNVCHSRSVSAPKSMPVVARHESGTTTTTTTSTGGQGLSNVSNVNVDFYRAVPVNVVASVPTIRCLNSSGDGRGNDVSNVQVLPLGSSFPSMPKSSTASFFSTQPSSCVLVPSKPSLSSGIAVPWASNGCAVGSTPSRLSAPCGTSGDTTNSCVMMPTASRLSASCGTSAGASNGCMVVPPPSRINVTCASNGSFVVPVPSRVNTSCGTLGSASSSMVPTPSRVRVSCGASGSIPNSSFAVPVPLGVNASCGISGSMSNSSSTIPAPLRVDASCGNSGSMPNCSFTIPAPSRVDVSCNIAGSMSNSSFALPAPSRVNASCSNLGSISNSSFAVPAPSRVDVSCGISGSIYNSSFAVPTPSRVDASCVASGSTSGSTVQVLAGSQPQIQIKTSDARTFTSTEAQTDEVSVLPAVEDSTSRRRRDRRERRQQRRGASEGAGFLGNPRLPDLLNSHRPPPYATLSNGAPPPQMLPPPHGAVLQTVVPPNGFVFPAPNGPMGHQVPLVQGPSAPGALPHPGATGFRLPFPVAGFSRGRFPEDHPKGCCGLLSWKPGSLRWFIALIALVAVCCVLVGTALGAMRPSGRDHLTVSLLMIGVGIVLVTVSGVAWRLTSHDAPTTCRSMLGLSGATTDATTDAAAATCAGRFAPRPLPPYGRPHHPYAAMMYPEFRCRPPPPSYQASMQEYRLRLLLLDRGGADAAHMRAGLDGAASPPPTYRSHSGSLLRVPLSGRRETTQSEYSCPPSYRSQNSSNRQSAAQPDSALHSREHSTSESERSIVNVDPFKLEPDPHDGAPMKLSLEGGKGGNLVTIVQTEDRTPVIVTVSGNPQTESAQEMASEIEILAHL